MKARNPIRNEIPTVAEPIAAMTLFDRRLPKKPLIAAPINGRTGISQSRSNAPMSPLQQVAAIHVERFAITKHRNHQSQSHRSFCSRHHQNKENENLAADLSMLAGESNKGQI